jgi:CRP-like cAMP-binding protein
MPRFAEQLANLPLFSACSGRDLQRLAKAADELTVPAGTALTTQGGVGREAFVILEGTAEVTKDGVHAADLGPGDHFGELALLDGGPRTATVTTTSDMTLLVLSKPAFNAVLDEIPTLAHKLLIATARRLRESEQSLSH